MNQPERTKESRANGAVCAALVALAVGMAAGIGCGETPEEFLSIESPMRGVSGAATGAPPMAIGRITSPESGDGDGAADRSVAAAVAESIADLYESGLRAREGGAYELALVVFDRVVEEDPTYGKVQTNRALVLLALDRPREALAAARRGVRQDYRSGVAHHVLGRCYHALGLVEEAQATYREAIRQDSGFAWPFNNLAVIEIEGGRYAEAEPLLREAVARDAENPVFKTNLGAVLERLGRLDEARGAYRAAIESDPTYEKAIVALERLKGVREGRLTPST